MDINFDRINRDFAGIISEFEGLLNNGKYSEAKTAVEDLMYELGANTHIKLSIGGNTADHTFHEIYLQITQKLRDRESSPAATTDGGTFDDLKVVLETATADIFKTAEVRQELIKHDPEMQAYREALQEGIAESTRRKENLEKERAKYDFIERELFVDIATGTDRRQTIEKERENAKQLQEVIDTIDVINSNIAAKATTADPAMQASIQTQIDTQKNGLRAKLTQLQSQGLDISSLGAIDDFLQDANLATSKTNTEALRDVRIAILIQEYEAIRTKLNEAKNGSITYTDPDGNVTDISNEEVIRLLPDLSTIDLNTDAGRNQIESMIQQITAVSKRIRNEMIVCDQEVEIYTDHVNIIDIEAEILSRDVNNRQAYIDAFDPATKTKIDQEKTMRHDDAQAKFSGDRKKAKQYKEAWKRFKAHRRTMTASEWVNGVNYSYEYDYLEDYPEKEDDLIFMQLESWEEKSKRTALINKMLEGVTDPAVQLERIASAYKDESIAEVEQLLVDYASGAYGAYSNGAPVTADMWDAAQQALNEARSRIAMQFARDQDYVEHYNSSHFDVRDTVALALTGGSAMRSRKNQSKGNLTFGDAVRTFFKWTPYDVKADGRRHVILTTMANIGGIVSLPVRTLKVALGAAIAAPTALIGRITGTYNMPTPYNVGYFHRKEARQEYYREHGSTRIGAWFKSFFNLSARDQNGNVIRDNNGKRVSVNEQIIQDRCRLIDESIEDKYIRGARAKLIEEQVNAKKNQRARSIAFKNRAKSAELYEDILENDPEYIAASPEEKKKIAQRAMQRAALALGGKTARPITDQSRSYVTNGRRRDGRFDQDNPEDITGDINFDLHQDLDFSETVGDTIWTNAVSRENIQRGNTKGMDLALRIGAAATLPFFKGLLSKWTIVTKNRKPDIVEPDTRTPDTVIPGRHTEGHYEYVPGTTTIYQHRPRYRDVTEDITVTEEVPITYDNATFGDLVRGKTAQWCAKWETYHGPHKPGIFSDDAREVQGFNLSFDDPATGQHIEWSTSMNEIKQFINEHPGLHEATTTYQDLSGLNGVDINRITEYMPDNIRESYIRYINAAVNRETAFNSATRICVGIPSKGGPIMSQGWCEGDLPVDAVKTISHIEQITRKVPDGEDVIPVQVATSVRKWIEGKYIPGKVIPGKVIPGKVIPGGYETIDVDQAMVVGAMADAGHLLAQGISPVYRRAQRGTRNYHGVDVNGNATIDGNQGRSDMYDTPVVTDHADPEKRTYRRYEHHHSINDRALSSRDSQGRPTKEAQGRTWDEDDFTL